MHLFPQILGSNMFKMIKTEKSSFGNLYIINYGNKEAIFEEYKAIRSMRKTLSLSLFFFFT